MSGGEAQRIRLATQIGAGLVGVLYVLDEPSIGLHQRDNERLLQTLEGLRDLGNSVLVVEHDEDTIRARGLHSGSRARARACAAANWWRRARWRKFWPTPHSLTGQYLTGELDNCRSEKADQAVGGTRLAGSAGRDGK